MGMKKLINETKELLSEKYNLLTKQQKDEPLTHEFEEERIIRERKENPTVNDKQSRAYELESIRNKQAERNIGEKEASKQKSNTGDEVAEIIETVSNHSREAMQTVHDFVGGESRSQQLSYVRQRKTKSRGIER